MIRDKSSPKTNNSSKPQNIVTSPETPNLFHIRAKVPDNIETLKENYNKKELFDDLAFRRDAMIVGLLDVAKIEPEVDKKAKINQYISKLEELQPNDINFINLNRLHDQIVTYLNQPRSVYFSNNNNQYCKTIQQADEYIENKIVNHQAKSHKHTFVQEKYSFSINDLRSRCLNTLEDHEFYELFEYAFVKEPVGIFIDQENLATQIMNTAIIKVIENKRLKTSCISKIFKQVFMNPTGVLANSEDNRTKSIINAVINLIRKNYIPDIFNYHLEITNHHPNLKLFEELLITKLVNNKIYDPEVINKIAARIAEGTIDITISKQNINFFVELSKKTNTSLLHVLSKHLEYFINQENGIDDTKNTLANQLLITPQNAYYPAEKDLSKYQQLKEIFEQITSYDEKFKAVSKEIYYNYILNTLPYRSYSNVLAILNSDSGIPDEYQHKLQLVITYCQLNNLDKDDNSTLNLFIAKDNHIKQDILIYLHNLEYLNDKNLEGTKLEHCKVNYFTNHDYYKLEQAFEDNTNSDNDTKITFLSDTVLFNNLAQLKLNNKLNNEIALILDDFIETKTITRDNLEKVIKDYIVKHFLKELDSQILSINHLEKIIFPPYLNSIKSIEHKYLNMFESMFMALPYEIKNKIFNYLDFNSLNTVRKVNKAYAIKFQYLVYNKLLPHQMKKMIYSYLDFNSLKTLRTVNKYFLDQFQHLVNNKSIISDMPPRISLDQFEDLIKYIQSKECAADSLTVKLNIESHENLAKLVTALNKAPWITSLRIIQYKLLRNLTTNDIHYREKLNSLYITQICKLIHIKSLNIDMLNDNGLTALCASTTLQHSLQELLLDYINIDYKNTILELGNFNLTKLIIIPLKVPEEYIRIICGAWRLQTSLRELSILMPDFYMTKGEDVRGNFPLEDVKCLNNLPNLTHLSLRSVLNGLKLVTLCSLDNPKNNLTHLDISNNSLGDNNTFTHLRNLNSLVSLRMQGLPIPALNNEYLKIICQIQNLTDLNINYNSIKLTNVVYLNELPYLTRLEYRFNPINNNKELKSFCDTKIILKLTELYITLNEFNDETCSILINLKKLKKLGLCLPRSCTGTGLSERLKIIFNNIEDIYIYIDEISSNPRLLNKRLLAEFPRLQNLKPHKGGW